MDFFCVLDTHQPSGQYHVNLLWETVFLIIIRIISCDFDLCGAAPSIIDDMMHAMQNTRH